MPGTWIRAAPPVPPELTTPNIASRMIASFSGRGGELDGAGCSGGSPARMPRVSARPEAIRAFSP